MAKVLIDCGHGRTTRGKRSCDLNIGITEWDWNRDIGRMLEDRLLSDWINCETITPGPIAVSLRDRVAYVNHEAKKSDCFLISIHANAAGDGAWSDASGARMFIRPNSWNQERKEDHARSKLCAESLQREFENASGIPYAKNTRGMREINYKILRVNCPAVLVEAGFYTNIEDVKFMKSRDGKMLITQAVGDGIVAYLEGLK